MKNELSCGTPLFFHKQVIPMNYTLVQGTTMSTRYRINLVIAGFLLAICIIGRVTAASVGNTWHERPHSMAHFPV